MRSPDLNLIRVISAWKITASISAAYCSFAYLLREPLLKNNQEILLDHANFALQEQAEDNLMVTFSWAWYNGSYTMAAKPIKSLELHYTVIQFLIIITRYARTSEISSWTWEDKIHIVLVYSVYYTDTNEIPGKRFLGLILYSLNPV